MVGVSHSSTTLPRKLENTVEEYLDKNKTKSSDLSATEDR